jgi:hypothetical protein
LVINVVAAAALQAQASVMKMETNHSDQPEKQFESTYALVVRSAEKSRNVIEALIAPLLVLGPILALFQFVSEPINIPTLERGEKPELVAQSDGGAAKRQPLTRYQLHKS